MSVWTHIAGIIRLDSLFTHVYYEDVEDLIAKSEIPSGSEGMLGTRVLSVNDKDYVHTLSVVIDGDLRDFEDVEGVQGWLENVFGGKDFRTLGLTVRDASVQMACENGICVNTVFNDQTWKVL